MLTNWIVNHLNVTCQLSQVERQPLTRLRFALARRGDDTTFPVRRGRKNTKDHKDH